MKFGGSFRWLQLNAVYQRYKGKLKTVKLSYLVGVDIMVDEDGKCWFIEANFNANLYLNMPYLYNSVIKGMAKDIINLYKGMDNGFTEL